MSRNAPTELTLAVHGIGPHSLVVSETGEADGSGQPPRPIFLPRTKVTLDDANALKLARYRDTPRGVRGGRGVIVLTLTIPEWLAYDRGLI